MVFSILTRAGDSASIPCLATDPGVVNLSLEPCHGGALPTGLHYVASLERGMVIFDTKKAFEGCYICTGRLGGAHVKSHHYDLTVRPGKRTLSVYVLGCEVQCPDLLFDIQHFLSQSQTRPLWLRCGNPRGWSWHGARLLPWPAAPPTSTETSSWSGPHLPARWEPFALSLGLGQGSWRDTMDRSPTNWLKERFRLEFYWKSWKDICQIRGYEVITKALRTMFVRFRRDYKSYEGFTRESKKLQDWNFSILRNQCDGRLQD